MTKSPSWNSRARHSRLIASSPAARGAGAVSTPRTPLNTFPLKRCRSATSYYESPEVKKGTSGIRPFCYHDSDSDSDLSEFVVMEEDCPIHDDEEFELEMSDEDDEDELLVYDHQDNQQNETYEHERNHDEHSSDDDATVQLTHLEIQSKLREIHNLARMERRQQAEVNMVTDKVSKKPQQTTRKAHVALQEQILPGTSNKLTRREDFKNAQSTHKQDNKHKRIHVVLGGKENAMPHSLR